MIHNIGLLEEMYNYSIVLDNGEEVLMNKEEAYRDDKNAADKVHLEAINNYGLMLVNGDCVAMNKEKAHRYFKTAADGLKGHPFNLADIFKVENLPTSTKRASRMKADELVLFELSQDTYHISPEKMKLKA